MGETSGQRNDVVGINHLSDNETVTSAAGIVGPVITVDYEYYIACRFTGVAFENDLLAPGQSLTNEGIHDVEVSLVEWKPGDRFA